MHDGGDLQNEDVKAALSNLNFARYVTLSWGFWNLPSAALQEGEKGRDFISAKRRRTQNYIASKSLITTFE